ncbi:MAG: hypothetical protein LBC18_10160 [Opitutaceae bacterium]|jgi:hypothetical protein|nr:hypothetical protein [Opitutaceae bacterium]
MRFFLCILCASGFVQTAPAFAAAPLSLSSADWTVKIDPASGALVEIRNARDPRSFNFLREPGRWEGRKWVADTAGAAAAQGGHWGLVETAQTGMLHAAQTRRPAPGIVESEYISPVLTVTVRRELDAAAGTLGETCTFKNTGQLDLSLPRGSVAVTAPLFDQYPDARRSLAARCHAHLWMGGHSAWINAMRMDASPPHLGLVVTAGALDAYSQRGGTLGDRGTFLLHPAAMTIPSGQSRTLSWKLFWHDGWDDFFAKARKLGGQFVQLSARNHTVIAGGPVEVTAAGPEMMLSTARLSSGGESVGFERAGGMTIFARIPTTPGSHGGRRVELAYGPDNTLRTWLVANVVPPPRELIRRRVEFIVRHQQRRAPGDPLDGAYLGYDNETGKQVYAARPSDHNAGRERAGMGVLCAMWLPLCEDAAFRACLAESLARHAAFVARELEDDDGTVYGGIGREDSRRLYNFPWVARFHLAMFKATGEGCHLDRFVRIVRRFYERGGAAFYPIGMPVLDGLETLAQAGPPRAAEHAELLEKFRAHAGAMLKTGKDYPPSEVNYEQSIVAPAVQFLLEMHHATGGREYLDGARGQMPFVDAFNGRQPDHHLHEIAIRHWDDFWFGKLGLYGDTFPHYWSGLTGLVFAYYAKALDDSGEAASRLARAGAAVMNNLSLFTPDGRGSAAHLYPFSTNGVRAARDDPWANDQDWALVHLLLLEEITRRGP